MSRTRDMLLDFIDDYLSSEATSELQHFRLDTLVFVAILTYNVTDVPCICPN